MVCAPSAFGAQTVIGSAGPLTGIYVNDDLGCSVDRASQTQVFGGTDPGSCGTFLAVGGSVYGPETVSPTTIPLTPFSQTLTGSGTSGSPYEIETIADAGATGLRLTQTDSYVVGDDFYTTDVEVSNTGASQAVALYHAVDCLLRGDDGGVGYSAPPAIYCSRGPSGAGVAAGVLGFEPITAGANFIEADFGSVFDAVNGSPLPDTCDCPVFQDHGAGISWSFTAAPGPATLRSFRTRVSADTRAPQTTITDDPGSPTSERTPTFSFGTDEASATFECSVDGPAIPTAPCNDDQSHTTSPLSPGPHVFRVVATDPDGNQDASPATASFTVGGSPAVPQPPAAAVPVATTLSKPVLGKTANVGLVSGKVRVRKKGSKGYVNLKGPLQMAVGSTVDTKQGRVTLTMAATGGTTSTAQFQDGVFTVLQAKTKDLVPQMKLVGGLQGCGKGKGGASEVRGSAKKRSKRGGRRLRGTAKGPFRMRGTYSSATSKAGTWLVHDRCDRSTLTSVGSGRVVVRDFAKRKMITLKKGRKYIAKARKRKARR